ncbi:Crp/Fnr family transcriptional regulator [Chitinophaga vietnamensis]|uniref:Crp/Fnr family transcriptional regulator n=1 Tax=Chitinophaga vietnamensis TaxID=2593957 RepID=UPI0011781AE2|nr:Crp/Fnr family transcriptional regulator [Chitinophaga vietnamensis]
MHIEGRLLLLNNIDKHITIGDEEKSYFLSLLQERTYYKKELLLREGDTCTNFTFICKGFAKSYLVDKKGDQHILTIASKDWWVADVMSYVSSNPGNLFIEAIETTHTLLLSRVHRLQLLEKVPAFERYFRILTERAFAVSQQRIVDILSLPAAERFEKFQQQYAHIASALTQQQIASFIGVTPAFFSRMLKAKRK